MKKIANDNPWIVALLVVVIGLPISIILYLLCSSSPKKVEITLIKMKFNSNILKINLRPSQRRLMN